MKRDQTLSGAPVAQALTQMIPDVLFNRTVDTTVAAIHKHNVATIPIPGANIVAIIVDARERVRHAQPVNTRSEYLRLTIGVPGGIDLVSPNRHQRHD